MKAFAIVVLAVLSIGLCRGADPVANLKRDATKCTEAWNRSDYRPFLDLLADPVLKGDQERDAVIKEVSQILGAFGLESLNVSIGEPQPTRKTGSLQSSIVPVTALMEGRNVRITAASYVLAVSRDGGNTWKFVVLYQRSDAQINALFREFQGKFSIPPIPRAVVIEHKMPNQSPQPSHSPGG